MSSSAMLSTGTCATQSPPALIDTAYSPFQQQILPNKDPSMEFVSEASALPLTTEIFHAASSDNVRQPDEGFNHPEFAFDFDAGLSMFNFDFLLPNSPADVKMDYNIMGEDDTKINHLTEFTPTLTAQIAPTSSLDFKLQSGGNDEHSQVPLDGINDYSNSSAFQSETHQNWPTPLHASVVSTPGSFSSDYIVNTPPPLGLPLGYGGSLSSNVADGFKDRSLEGDFPYYRPVRMDPMIHPSLAEEMSQVSHPQYLIVEPAPGPSCYPQQPLTPHHDPYYLSGHDEMMHISHSYDDLHNQYQPASVSNPDPILRKSRSNEAGWMTLSYSPVVKERPTKRSKT